MHEPANISEIQEAVRDSASLIPVGAETKPALGSVPDSWVRISMKGLSGVIEYDPGEFTITVLAGTSLEELNAVLREQGQYLPFDPPLAAAGATIGGTVAAGLSGPGAFRFGPIRDFLIGIRYVDSEARVMSGGGKVVKNAAGFDTPKYLIGSAGRLGILVELTFKVFPEPESRSSFSVAVDDSRHAARLISQLGRGTFDLEALGYAANENTIRGRLAGNKTALEARLTALADELGNPDQFSVLPPDEANAFWNRQLGFEWCDPNLPLAKYATTATAIADHEENWTRESDIHYSIGGNVAWTSAPLDLLESQEGWNGPGLLIRHPKSPPSSIWTSPRRSFAVEDQLKQVFDRAGKFPSF